MKTRVVIAALILSFLLAGAALGAEADELYYPLKQGMTWEYTSGGKAGKKITISNLASRQMDDKTVIPRKWDMGGTVKYVLVARDEGGIYKYAEQKSETAEPTIIKPREYYLRYPIAEKATWETVTKLGEVTINLTLTLESITDEMTVPAGTFKDCLKIKQAGTNLSNGQELSVTVYEWYAPKVGLIKSMGLIKKKPKNQPVITDNFSFELQSFKP